MVLISNALVIIRDYQDSWILEGLEIPFVLFVTIYVAAFFFEKKISWMIILAIIGRLVFLIIPNLKYVWFQGPYIDQQWQYVLSNYICKEGYISTEKTFSHYTTVPFTHLSFSIFSFILGISVVDSIKYLPVLTSSIYPLLTYMLVEKMEFSERNTILKYSLFLSSIPNAIEQYIITGRLFGILFVFLILFNIILILQKKDKRYWLLYTILIFTLATAHPVTIVILMALLLIIILIQRFSYLQQKSNLRLFIILLIASITAAWLMFQAQTSLQTILYEFFVAVPRGTTPTDEYIHPGFYEHIRANIFSALKSFSVHYGADTFFLILTLTSQLILIKNRKKLNNIMNVFFTYIWLTFLLMIIGFFLKLGILRVLHFIRILFPISSSILILHISKNKYLKTLIYPIILFIIILAPIELYICQPLVPSANVLYKDVPPEVPIGYLNLVNTIYQRHIIKFSEFYLSGTIVSDHNSQGQIIGLTEINFSIKNSIRYYPLDKNQRKRPYDYFLIRLPGKSGSLKENVAIVTPNQIIKNIYNSSIIYTNSQSHIIINRR